MESKPPSEKKRRPYEAPRIDESGRFERLVLTCTHTPGTCAGKGASPSS